MTKEGLEKDEEFIESTELLNRVYSLRSKVNELRKGNYWDDTVIAFNKNLKLESEEKFGKSGLWQEVDVWQALIGGTIENRVNITPEQYNFFVRQIDAFIFEQESVILG